MCFRALTRNRKGLCTVYHVRIKKMPSAGSCLWCTVKSLHTDVDSNLIDKLSCQKSRADIGI